MFKNLSERLSVTLKKITGKASISEGNIQETLREVRMALLEADVALPVVKSFLSQVKERALGHEVKNSLNPGQQFLKIVQAELTAVMGEENQRLELSVQPPAVILMAGMQGSGKTTSSAKLARYLKEQQRKKVMMVSVDINRAAAIKQLEILASEVGVDFFPTNVSDKP
ncbi:MAG: signal recognition particle protein, partial [Cellvibrionales bacterium TMED148]